MAAVDVAGNADTVTTVSRGSDAGYVNALAVTPGAAPSTR